MVASVAERNQVTERERFDHNRFTVPPFAEIMSIDPDLAGHMLGCGRKNRDLRASRIRFYAHEITAEQWCLNGQTIIFSSDGSLIEGQHRLQAIIVAGKAITTFVVFGVDPSVFDTIDTNMPRALADVFTEHGEDNTKSLAAAVHLVWQHEKGTLHWGSGGVGKNISPPSHRDLENTLRDHPRLRDSLSRRSPTHAFIPPAVAVALHYLFSIQDETLANLFWDGVADGTGLTADDPVRLLRERLLRDRLGKTRLRRTQVLALIIKAWNATREGKKLKTLAWRNLGDKPEPFPTIL